MPISDSQTDIPALDAETLYVIGSHQATIA